MRRFARLLPLVGLVLLLLLQSAFAAPQRERRVALIIGNSAYKDAPLKNPVNDARDMAAALKKLGFEATLLTDATMQQMESAVREFGLKLRQGGMGLFYYAGHGVQVGGNNYLVPVKAVIQSESDVKYGCLDAGLVLGKMEDAGNGLNLIILDACRNNPFARSFRSAEQGLAKMDAPTGSLIAYATSPGKTAADGDGKNGLYTKHLLKNIATPGLSVEDLFKRVRQGVAGDSARKQVPWEASSLIGQFSFAGGEQTVEQPKPLALAPAPKEVPKQAPPPAAEPKAAEPKAGDTWRDPTTGMEFVWVPGGTFEMGCGSWAGDCKADEKPVHVVRLDGFWLGRFEVTQGQWQIIMESNPSYFKEGDNFPVEMVSWKDAKGYISRLNAQGSAKFRLPTEAEWEYAARSGGKPEKYAGGNDLGLVAWFHSNSGSSTHEVGTKAPNGLGLYDMTGNVREWCEDVYGPYPSAPQENPVVTVGWSRLSRGGSWAFVPEMVRAAYRLKEQPNSAYGDSGFRLVRTD
ncbi:MAG: SUMF1/EgtB/PvdO family nonheme iron enzyme [Proteobacteria bacterium]|nr:SUMF1/EgtB/PvdO family nonheme iron enzyme [Pseudomonadota bacterium]